MVGEHYIYIFRLTHAFIDIRRNLNASGRDGRELYEDIPRILPFLFLENEYDASFHDFASPFSVLQYRSRSGIEESGPPRSSFRCSFASDFMCWMSFFLSYFDDKIFYENGDRCEDWRRKGRSGNTERFSFVGKMSYRFLRRHRRKKTSPGKLLPVFSESIDSTRRRRSNGVPNKASRSDGN